MTPPFCALCLRSFTPHGPARSSREHIIPAALGGHWISADVLCTACNSDLGATADAHLAAWAAPVVSLLYIRHGRTRELKPYAFTAGGQRYEHHAPSGHVTALGFTASPETLTATGAVGQEDHIRKSVRGAARGRPGQVHLEYLTAPGVPVPLDLDVTLPAPEQRRALAKIAYLGAAALLGPAAFAQVDAGDLRGAVRGQGALDVTVAPGGAAAGLRRMGHGVSLHVLPDGRLGALVILFGTLRYLVPVGLSRAPLLAPLPAMITRPLVTEEDVRAVIAPPAPLNFSADLARMLGDFRVDFAAAQREAQHWGVLRRAWYALQVGGDPFTPGWDDALTPAQREAFGAHVERESEALRAQAAADAR